MAIKKKNPESNYNAVPLNGNWPTAPENESYTPPHTPSKEVIDNFEKNMDMAFYLLEAIQKTPVVIDEEVQKILNDRFEKSFVQLTGIASDTELHISS